MKRQRNRLVIHLHSIANTCSTCVSGALREGEIKGLLRAARLAKVLMGKLATHQADASVGDLVVRLRGEAVKLRKGGR